MMHLVALLEPPQDRDGVRHRGFIHPDLLEAPLQRRILLHALAVFIQRGRADAVQLPAGQRRLQHIAGVDGALRLARADHVVQFVDEENDLALLLGQFVEYRLEAFLELAAKLRAGYQGPEVQGEDPLGLDALGHLAVGDALCQPLDDGRLAHPRFPDEHRIVLGAPLQHLDGTSNLVVAADHRVELTLLRLGGEIHRVLLQCLAGLLRIRVVHAGATADLVDGLLHGARDSAGVL